ncbi:MAG: hypothetical protein KatS3mg110_2013 [Pirellulaceae bacterium]|nr:MAG: hypothetical protein KatS3mg110_2013 [Pirellulaceae bacterium]
MKVRCAVWLLSLLVGATWLVAQQSQVPPVEKATLGRTPNVHACGSLLLAGQPGPEELGTLPDRGVRRVISLRTPQEISWDEKQAAEARGLEFLQFPLGSPDDLTDDVLDRLRALLRQSDQVPTLLHCGSANRVGAVWLTHRVLDQNVPLEKALQEAREVGLRSPEFEARARQYIQRRQRASVPENINSQFLNPNLNLEEWIHRFEAESRELYTARHAIVEATAFRPGFQVADVGAGTGLFTRLFADVVGSDGWVYAVDIAPKFLQHIVGRAREEGLQNVTAVLCSPDSVTLPPDSLDGAFIADTYHHFEYPQATLASLYRALRSGGSLIVVDFERIPGKSREWILNHVRADKETVRSEIESVGFRFVEEVKIDGLKENYFLRFRKP